MKIHSTVLITIFGLLGAVAQGPAAERSAYEVIHAVGNRAPAGVEGVIVDLRNEHISREGNLLYEATIRRDTGERVEAIYRRMNGVDELVYLEGQPLPGDPTTRVTFATVHGASDGGYRGASRLFAGGAPGDAVG